MKEMLWHRLFSQLSAIEVLGVCRVGNGLNARGERILNYLRLRLRRIRRS